MAKKTINVSRSTVIAAQARVATYRLLGLTPEPALVKLAEVELKNEDEQKDA